ncbi:MAG TPA: hypothetical protein PL151_19805 [Phycisphaerae bacterium]|nr:hypothetical protein [Phycisphaerae bacterium]HOQ86053.1 hypothetical protein [Phycisphaerae bacterium]HPU28350.1 hypothetical protein [Phycisphaerae bacterium]HPZ98663.1 hypothetical protein [Phycisphaerae bacterium]HQE30001.1 hypothetical protein [Phycisphaerae bacterium]
MKRHHRRRGIGISEVLFLVPIVAAAFTVTYTLSVRALRMQHQTLQAFAGDAIRADLLRRIGEDAACAHSATLERSEGATVLELHGCPSVPSAATQDEAPMDAHAARTVQYQIAGNHVLRTEQPADETSGAYKWTCEEGQVDLALERINDTPRMVWIMFMKRQPRNDGPELIRKLTAAVRIGPGGTP